MLRRARRLPPVFLTLLAAIALAACSVSSSPAPAAVRDGSTTTGPVGSVDRPTSDEAPDDDPAPSGDPGVVGGPDPTPNVDAGAALDDQWHDAAARGGPDERTTGPAAEQCVALADQPLTARSVVGDPVAELRSGGAASVFGTDLALDVVVEFDTFEDYPDPSTPADLDALLQAWREAGFRGGVAAKRQQGNNLVMATVVEFASPEDARRAVRAHLRDLCTRSTRAERHADGAGMTILRESGSVRSVSAAGPYELSFYVCVCVADADDDRFEALEDWRRWQEERWTGPGEDDGEDGNPIA